MGGEKLLGLWLTRDRDELHEQMRHGCCSESDRLRKENARLTGELAEIRCELRKHDARDIPITSIEMIRNLTRERDEAREEVKRSHNAILHLTAEVARLEKERDEARAEVNGLDVCYAEAQEIAVNESVGRRSAEAEVARLEGLADGIEAEAREVAPGKTFYGGPLHGASVFNVMMWAVRRIRAQREHKHHWFTFDETHVRCDGCGETRREEGRVLYVGEVEPT